MVTTVLFLCLGIPAAVCLMIVVEEYIAAGRPITRDRMVKRLRHVFGAGLLFEKASAGESAGGALRLFAWTAALGSVLAEMLHVWPAGNGIAIWLVLMCGGLEIMRYLSATGADRKSAALLGNMTAWLAIICAMAGLGFLFGSFNFATIALVQARAGFWTAAVQPLGCAVFVFAAIALCLIWRDRPRDIELIEYLQCIVLALLAVGLFGGGWHFWGISTYTSGDDDGWATAVLRVMVVAAKSVAVLCGLSCMRSKSAARRAHDITGNVLLAVSGANLMVALAAETWLRPEDFLTRGLLSWIVAGGVIAYGSMFHRTRMTAIWKGQVADEVETGC